MNETMVPHLTRSDLEQTVSRLAPFIIRTPTLKQSIGPLSILYPNTEFYFKYELFQLAGTFKSRGVLNNLLGQNEKLKGVTAASAGNHAIAVAVVARQLGLKAHVAMQQSANPLRVNLTREAGATIDILPTGKETFARAEQISAEKGYQFVHPFDGLAVTQASAGITQEIFEDVGPLDALFVAVGGGGLSGGVSAGAALLAPDCAVYGVEPDGAPSMHKSFAAGHAVTLEAVSTIADSLGPPMTTPHCYEVNRANLFALMSVTDREICHAMRIMCDTMHLAVEPAAATSLAGLMAHASELAPILEGKKVGVIICGSNIDYPSFRALVDSDCEFSE